MSPDNSNGLHFKELFGVTSSLLTFLPVWLIPRGRGSSITPAGGSTAGTSGAHLFQGRFDAVLVGGEGEWLEVARYVHLNLVRVARLGLPKSDQQQRQKTAAAARDPRGGRSIVNNEDVTPLTFPDRHRSFS